MLSVFDFLMFRHETKFILYEFQSFMIISINSNYKKFEKYWNKIIVKISIYIIAIILNFNQKWNYFVDWNENDKNKIKRLLQRLWFLYNMNYSNQIKISISITFEKIIAKILKVFAFKRWMKKSLFNTKSQNELKQYLNESRCNESKSILSWWKLQRKRFSVFTQLIINIFIIFNINFESKRIFSEVKHIVNKEKYSLHANIIETLKCLKLWFRADIFIQIDITTTMNKKLKKKNWKNKK